MLSTAVDEVAVEADAMMLGFAEKSLKGKLGFWYRQKRIDFEEGK